MGMCQGNPDEKDYAAAARPEFGGPLHIGGAARAVEEAANEAKQTAAKAGALIDLLTEMATAFRKRFSWFFPVM